MTTAVEQINLSLAQLQLSHTPKRVTKPTTYTRKFVLHEVSEMLAELHEDKSIVYKGELFETRPYSYKRLSEWASQFKDDPEISDSLKKIDETLETRAVVGGLKNKLNASILKFHLINNYNWAEKSEVATTNTSLDVVGYIQEVEKRNARIRAEQAEELAGRREVEDEDI